MANHNTKLEITWIGKENRPLLVPQDQSTDNKTLNGLATSCTFKGVGVP